MSCSSGEAELTPAPEGVVVHIDQSRIQRNGRLMFLRVENNTQQQISIREYRLTSPRFTDVSWSGDEEIGATYETDLEFTMPPGRCGGTIDAVVELTYRVNGGADRRSRLPADDRYGNALDFADRDCTQHTLESAANLKVGTPVVEGTGRNSVLNVPVTMTPTGKRSDVRFAGFGDTTLFRQTSESPAAVDVPLGGPAVNLTMQIVPARCDAHVLAEDKVGRLFAVKVIADGLAPDASYFLPLSTPQRKAMYSFFRSHCSLTSGAVDPQP